MTRTVLYYPTIAIPNGAWLRRALFYFDEVASIVPRTMSQDGSLGPLLVPTSPEVDLLLAERVFRPMAPDNLMFAEGGNWARMQDFIDDFLSALKVARYEETPRLRMVKLHKGKIAQSTLYALQEIGLVQEESPDKWTEWFLVEERTADLFMATLAQHMADIDEQYTVPGTDSSRHENLVYQSRPPEGSLCIETRFLRVVPTPRDDVSLTDILEFKRKRDAELQGYRARVDELQLALSEAESHTAVKRALTKFEETQRKELSDMVAAMHQAGIGTVWGSLKTLVKTSKPALWGAAAAIVAPVAPPASVAFAGLAAAGAVEATAYLLDRRNERRANARKFAFAYVQHAHEEDIL